MAPTSISKSSSTRSPAKSRSTRLVNTNSVPPTPRIRAQRVEGLGCDTDREQPIRREDRAGRAGVEDHVGDVSFPAPEGQEDVDIGQAVRKPDLHPVVRLPSQDRSAMSSSVRSVCRTYISRAGASRWSLR